MAKRSGKRTYRKSILKVGTHKSPDGEVTVTPERLEHWASQFSRLSDAGHVVPMHFDHELDPDNLDILTAAEFRAKKKPSAKDTVGRMTEFNVASDGTSAEVVFETTNKAAIEGFDDHTLFVSPVIMPSLEDGQSDTYEDFVYRLDAVNWPVDHQQSEAEAVEGVALGLRMGLASDVYRFAFEESDHPRDSDGRFKIGTALHKKTKAGGSSISLTDLQTETGLERGSKQDPLSGELNRTLVSMREAGELETVETRFGEPSFRVNDKTPNTAETPSSVSAAVKRLGGTGMHITNKSQAEFKAGDLWQDIAEAQKQFPKNAGRKAFQKAVAAAWEAAQGTKKMAFSKGEFDKEDKDDADTDDTEQNARPDDGNEQDDEQEQTVTIGSVLDQLQTVGIPLPDDTNANNFLDRLNVALGVMIASQSGPMDERSEETTVVEPQVTRMATAANNQANKAIALAEKGHRKTIATELKCLVNSGRCTPAEYDKYNATIGAVKLSLGDDGEFEPSRVESFIEDRAGLPAGALWDDDERLKRLSTVPQPGEVEFGDNNGLMNPEKSKETADAILAAGGFKG